MKSTNEPAIGKIKSQKLVARFGNAMLDYGFTTIPNTILFYKDRLEITAKELHLIIMVLALNGRGLYEINDKHLHPDGKSFIRQRKSLEKKGLLKFEIVKGVRDGAFTTLGIVYDFNGLRKKIEALVDDDNAILESEAPVQKIDDAPAFSQFQEFDNKPLDIPKAKNNDDDDDFNVGSKSSAPLTTNESDAVSTNEKNDFLSAFEALHFECLGKKINLGYGRKYRDYLLNGFNKRNCDFRNGLENAKIMFRNKSPSERTSLKLQDCVCNAFLKSDKQIADEALEDSKSKNITANGRTEISNSKNQNQNKISNGIEMASRILEKITSGVNVEEAFKYATNSG